MRALGSRQIGTGRNLKSPQTKGGAEGLQPFRGRIGVMVKIQNSS